MQHAKRAVPNLLIKLLNEKKGITGRVDKHISQDKPETNGVRLSKESS